MRHKDRFYRYLKDSKRLSEFHATKIQQLR